MSNAKFTKGEWLVKIEDGNAKVFYPHGFLTSANVIKVDDSRLDGESWIDMRERTKPARDTADDESNANMHLIATSPDMYEEIERDIIEIEARLIFADERTLAVNPDVAKLKRKKAILAKARGEQ